jgi:hypothetical protein
MLALAAAGLLATATPATAQNVVPGFTGSTVQRCDDCFTAATPLGFSANYFGNTYTNAFVSNNGYVTFSSGQSTFTPTGLGAGYSGQPIIAPFFADVDTRLPTAGTVTYGTGTFNGANAFAATWNDVGYFSNQTDKTNTFQLLLVDRSDIASGDFDIFFNYDRILWETGSASGGTNGFGGTSAAAGYNAGTGDPGTFFQLPGSLVNGALLDSGANALVGNSNIGDPGRFLFNVRSAVPEPGTWAMMLLGFGVVGAAMRRRRELPVRLAPA